MPSPAAAQLSPTDLAATLRDLIPLHRLATPSHLLEVATRWCERQRAWHGPAHVLSLVRQIRARPHSADRDVLLLTALYHDAVYDPRAADNESASAALLTAHAADPKSSSVTRAAELILASAWKQAPADPLTAAFFELDTFQLSEGCSLRERLA